MNNNEFIFFTGGMGTILQEKGLKAGELPEKWNILKSEDVVKIHYEYIMTGCTVVETNTFGANRFKYPEGSVPSLEAVIEAAVDNVKKAITQSGKEGVLTALDIGPTGKLLKPLGDLDFEEAVRIFAETIRIGVKKGVDLILIETMNDLYEAKAAVVAAKENSDVPVWVTCVFNENSRMLLGTDPLAMVTMMEGLGVEALGLNCSLAPDKMLKTAVEFKKHTSLPVIVNPNAGIPRLENGVTIFESTPEGFAKDMRKIAETGVEILGGCCGTTPEHIKKMMEEVKGLKPIKIKLDKEKIVSCSKGAIVIDAETEISEIKGMTDFEDIMDEAYDIIGSSDIMELDLQIPGDESGEEELNLLKEVLSEVQGVIGMPIMFNTNHPEVLEFALRNHNGKALIRMTDGLKNHTEKTMEIIEKYGGEIY